MSAHVKMSRVLPVAYPEIFQETTNAAGSRCESGRPGEPDTAAAAIQEKRLRSLYQRTLRNQGHREALTYSGRLTA